jgi:hypothetical protein
LDFTGRGGGLKKAVPDEYVDLPQPRGHLPVMLL